MFFVHNNINTFYLFLQLLATIWATCLCCQGASMLQKLDNQQLILN